MAVDVDGVLVPLRIQLRPLARTFVPLRTGAPWPAQPMPPAAASSSSRQWQSRARSPVIDVWPSTSRFLRRSSYGSSPNRAAIMSSCVSYAQAAWDTPYPRNAPAGGTFVYTAYESTQTFGIACGPPVA